MNSEALFKGRNHIVIGKKSLNFSYGTTLLKKLLALESLNIPLISNDILKQKYKQMSPAFRCTAVLLFVPSYTEKSMYLKPSSAVHPSSTSENQACQSHTS